MDLDGHRKRELVKDRLVLTAALGALVGAALGALAAYAVLTVPAITTTVATGPAVPDLPAAVWIPVAAAAALVWAGYGYVQLRGEWQDIGVLDDRHDAR